MVCVEKTEEDKEKFDTSKKGLQFWQKHRDKQSSALQVVPPGASSEGLVTWKMHLII